MTKDYINELSEMFERAGFKNIKSRDNFKRKPGNDIHEMGGVRMGKNKKTSLLNKWNQLHSCKNVFVTDGACMPSTSTQNPSLTFMAITARAANYAISQMKKMNIWITFYLKIARHFVSICKFVIILWLCTN